MTATRLWASVVEGVHLRLELFALEFGEERTRATELVLSAVVVVFATFMLILSMNVALLVLLWDTHRGVVAIGSCLFYALLALGSGLYHHRRSRRRAPPFAGTAAVLAQDEQALKDVL